VGRRNVRASSATAEPPSAQSRAKLTGRVAIVVLVVAVLAVSYASSMRAWLQQRSDINTLSAQIAAGRAEVAALREAKQRWHDPAYIRTQARLRFGWVMPGETGYRVIDDNGDILASGSQLSDPPVTSPKSSPEWWETAWSSVVAAGRDPADVAAAKAHRAAMRPTPAEQIGGRPHRGASERSTVDPGDRLVPDGGEGAGTVER
jgi:cell division protein FtsB